METLPPFVTPLTLGLLGAAVILILTNDWRVSGVILSIQYGLAALLVAQVAIWQVAAVKALVGVLAVGILGLSSRELSSSRARSEAPSAADEPPAPRPRLALLRGLEFSTNLPFRLAASLLVIVGVWYLLTESGYDFPNVPSGFDFASGLLVTLGLLNLGLTEEPMNTGAGLLTFITGFDLLYVAVEPSLAVVALMAAVHFGVALAISYLAGLRYARDEGSG